MTEHSFDAAMREYGAWRRRKILIRSIALAAVLAGWAAVYGGAFVVVTLAMGGL